jgi:tripartite-type tricarboxylate transporter receptor subunit TctC
MKSLPRLLLAAALCAACLAARAADFPDHPLRLVVGFSPGGGSDLVARALAQPLGAALGQSVIVDNRPGAGGMLATRGVAKEKPDGYTLLLGSAAAFVINPYLQSNVGYDPIGDFTPVAPVARFDYVLMGRKGLPAANLQELIQYAKAHPDTLTIGSAGIGSNTHLVALDFLARTGIALRHVPYKGTAGALNDLMSGNIDVLFDSVPTVTGQIKAGAVRAYATTGSTREPELPDVPTMAQAGVAHFTASNWFAIFGPKGMAPGVVRTLNDAIAKTLRDPAVKAAFERSGNLPLPGTPQDLAQLVQAETQTYKGLIERANIKLDVN